MIALTVAALAITGSACGGDDDDDFDPPGLIVLTPRVGAPVGGVGSILVWSDQPSRITIEDEGALIGAGRSGRFVSSIPFETPDVVSGGSELSVTVRAVAEGGRMEAETATLIGLGNLEQTPVVQDFFDVAAVEARAILAARNQLWLARAGSSEPSPTSITGEIQALAADEAAETVVVAGNEALLSTYAVSDSELTLVETLEFANYDGSSQPVSEVNALHVNGELIAAATARGMAIIDRAVDDPEPNCRRRSAMTTKLAPASYDPAMYAVVVTKTERVVAGGAYLNVYEDIDGTDPGGCLPPMSRRGTSVIAPPDDIETLPPWGTVTIALSEAFIWIGRRDAGLIRLPWDFELIESRYFQDGDLWKYSSSEFPYPQLNDVAAGSGNRAWIALTDEDGFRGGLLLISATTPGPELWIDGISFGGVPRAIDVATTSHRVWVITESTISTFSEPL